MLLIPHSSSTVHSDAKSLKQWVHYQTMDPMEQLFQWDERQLAVAELSTSYLENPRDQHSLEYLKTNPTRNLLMLWKYIHHLVMEAQSVSGHAFFILLPENFCKIQWRDFMTWRLNNCKESHSHTSPAEY